MQFATIGILAEAIGCRASVHIAWRLVSLPGRLLSSSRQEKYARSGACDSPECRCWTTRRFAHCFMSLWGWPTCYLCPFRYCILENIIT